MIRLTAQEHGTTRPISAEVLRAVLDDATYRRIAEQDFGKIFERMVKLNAEPAFTVIKIRAGESFVLQVQCSYFVGVDWVFRDAISIQVLPKIEDLDMPVILERVISTVDAIKEFDDLITIQHGKKPIPGAQDCDRFLLFIAAAFLQITRRIVRKGLLNTFRTEEVILQYRVKGRLRVSDTLRQMRLGDPFARAICSPQRFDADSQANRFLKFILRRMHALLSTHSKALGSSGRILTSEAARLLRAFGEVSDTRTWRQGEAVPVVNPLYSEYDAAFKFGRKFLLQEGIGAFKKSNQDSGRIVPYWIDMSQLFELYVFADLLGNKSVRDILYHRNFRPGGQPDFLIHLQGAGLPFKCCVADTKYKPRYMDQELNLNDARQVAGYGRLRKVVEWMFERGLSHHKHIVPCLIVHPDHSSKNKHVDFTKLQSLQHWEDFWKIGISLPRLPSSNVDTGTRKA